MNIVLLSPNFPINYGNFAIAARQVGATVLGVGDAPYDSLRPELRHALHEYYCVNRLDDYASLVKACGYFTYRYGKLDRIESHNEAWLQVDARLRSDFNVSGLQLDEIARLRRKSHMKRLFREAGLDVPAGVLMNSLDEAKHFIDQVGYPVVAKPDVGVGAEGTHLLTDEDSFRVFWTTRASGPYVLEQYVRGTLHSFDGLADQDGHIVFCSAHTYVPSIMHVVNEDLDVYARSMREMPEGLNRAGRRAVAAFGVRERFFHIEFIERSQDGGLLALEMNLRPPGGPMMDVLNYANDIDLYREWANVVMFNNFTATVAWPYCCAFVGRKRHRPHRYTHREIVDALRELIVDTLALPPVFARAMGDQGYILRSPDCSKLQEAIDFILTPA